MRDGKCVERWSTADMLGLLIQLGAVPPPGAERRGRGSAGTGSHHMGGK